VLTAKYSSVKRKQVLSSQHQTQRREVDGYRKESRPKEEGRRKETSKEGSEEVLPLNMN